jgi:hypothetical protein
MQLTPIFHFNLIIKIIDMAEVAVTVTTKNDPVVTTASSLSSPRALPIQAPVPLQQPLQTHQQQARLNLPVELNYVELAPTHPTNYLIPPHNRERTVAISLARNATLEMSIY